MGTNEASAKTGPRPWPVVVVLGAAALAAGGYFLLRPKRAEAPPAPPATPVAATASATKPVPDMPPEPEADAQVRQAAAGISSSPTWAEWLKNTGLARTFAAATNEIAEGLSPRTTLAFLAPAKPFHIVRHHHHDFIDPKSYQRFDTLADVVATINSAVAAKAYTTLHPLLTAAYAEIGRPGTTLDGQVTAAIQRLEAVQPAQKPVEVVQSGMTWKFADANLEAQSAVAKSLLRMGPHNMKVIQSKLHELAADLHLSPIAQAGSSVPHAE